MPPLVGFATPIGIGMWGRMASGGQLPAPPGAGTGYARWAEHWEAMARRKQALQEDDEIIAMMR